MPLRIECWHRKRADGTRQIYWQWAERKRGGRRIYGGKAEDLSPERLAQYWRRVESADPPAA